MQWYKHDTNASNDSKIKKLLIRHGAVGYAIYFHCLELIAGNLSESNITFELEHDAEIIADNLKIRGTSDESGVDIVNRVMRYIVEVGLFENDNGRITCLKLLKRLDQSMTSNVKMRSWIEAAKNNHKMIESCPSHDDVMTVSCKKRIEEKRIEEKGIVELSLDIVPAETVPHEKIIAYLNAKAGTAYRSATVATRRLIKARWNEGYREDDFYRVIDAKCKEWAHDAAMLQYLRPQTLFGTKFESYLQRAIPIKKQREWKVISEG